LEIAVPFRIEKVMPGGSWRTGERGFRFQDQVPRIRVKYILGRVLQEVEGVDPAVDEFHT